MRPCRDDRRRQSLLHRSDQVLDVDDQDWRAILHQRGGADVLDLSETRVERTNDQLASAEKTIDDEPVTIAAAANHEDAEAVAGAARLAAEGLLGKRQADRLAVEVEILPAGNQPDVGLGEDHGASEMGKRKRVGLTTDLGEKRADDRQGQGQLQVEPGADAGLRHDPADAADLLQHGLNDVEADAAPGDLAEAVLQGETGQEQEFEEPRLHSCEPRSRRLRQPAPPPPSRTVHTIDGDAATVVGDDDLERA